MWCDQGLGGQPGVAGGGWSSRCLSQLHQAPASRPAALSVPLLRPLIVCSFQFNARPLNPLWEHVDSESCAQGCWDRFGPASARLAALEHG